MIKASQVIQYLNILLLHDDDGGELSGLLEKDIMWNGIQVSPPENINKVFFAVSAGNVITKLARQNEAELIVTHHGLFWKGADPRHRVVREQVANLVEDNIGLYSCHLPLDKHPVVGNNATIARMLEATIVEEFGQVGYIAELKEALPERHLLERLGELFGQESWALPYCPKEKIHRLAIVSGAGGYPAFYEALDRNVDMLITGDTFECRQTARDAGLSVAFCGHHSTEMYGIKTLKEYVEREFPTELEAKLTYF